MKVVPCTLLGEVVRLVGDADLALLENDGSPTVTAPTARALRAPVDILAGRVGDRADGASCGGALLATPVGGPDGLLLLLGMAPPRVRFTGLPPLCEAAVRLFAEARRELTTVAVQVPAGICRKPISGDL